MNELNNLTMPTNNSSPNYRLIQIQSLGYFLVFTAFNAAQNLAGSIPGPIGLSAYTFAVLYGTFVIFCIPAPRLVNVLGPKYAMVIGATPYFGVLISHLIPPLCTSTIVEHCWNSSAIWSVDIILGSLCGGGAALVWTGQGVYLSRAVAHAAQSEQLQLLNINTDSEATNTRNTSSSSNVPSIHPSTPSTPSFSSKNEIIGKLNKQYNGTFWSVLQFSGSTGTMLAFLVTTFVPGIHTALHWLFVGLSIMCACGILVLAFCLPQLKAIDSRKTTSERYNGEDTDDTDDTEEEEIDRNISSSSLTPSGDTTTGSSTASAESTDVDVWATLRLCVYDQRMRCLVPIIFYNGASLGFLWNVFNVLGWNTSAGLSFVGLGSSFWFAVNSIFTPIMSRVSNSKGYMSSFVVATTLQSLMYVLLITFPITSLKCNPSGCITNTSGSCWKALNSSTEVFPLNCHDNSSSGSSSDDALNCVVCSPYQAAKGQKCDVDFNQCSWIGYPHGDAITPLFSTMFLMFGCSAMFAIGDAVWETQLPAVLQTIFETDEEKSSALANLKMFQSIGVSLIFAFAYLNDIQLMSMILLVLLGFGQLCAYYTHRSVINLDTGNRRNQSTEGSSKRTKRKNVEEQDALLS